MSFQTVEQTSVASQSGDQLRRRLLMLMLTLAWLGTVPGWILKELLDQSSPALRVVFALNAVFHPVMLLLLWKRYVRQRIIEFICLVFAALLCAGCMALSLYSRTYGTNMDLEPLYLWIPIIYVFAFVLFDHQSGLKLSLCILILFLPSVCPTSCDRGTSIPFSPSRFM